MYKLLLVLLVTFHILIVLGNLLAMLVLPFLAPWYVALPLCSFILRLATVERKCPLTIVENLLRRKLKMKQIRTFIGHYFIKPCRIYLNKK